MHLPGRSRAHLPLGRARSTLRPPIHARARGAAARGAIRGSLGRPLGRHRLYGGALPGLRSRARAPRVRASRVACCRPPATAYEHAVRRRLVFPRSFIPTTSRTHPPTAEFFPPLALAWDAGGCPPSPLWYRCVFPALAAGVARRRPFPRPPLLPLSFSHPCRRRGTLAAVPRPPPRLLFFAAGHPRVALCPRAPPVLRGRRRCAVCASVPRPLRPPPLPDPRQICSRATAFFRLPP